MIEVAAWKMHGVEAQRALRAITGTNSAEITDLSPATLDDLARIVTARQELEALAVDVARSAHAAGATWAEIGAVMGVTRQAAWERFAERAG